MIDILYITYNRIECTKITLPKLISSTSCKINLTIIDNGSSDGSVTYLKKIVDNNLSQHKIRLIINNENQGLSKPTNFFWKQSNANLVGKIDNDILVEDGWLEKLVGTHKKMASVSFNFSFSPNSGLNLS